MTDHSGLWMRPTTTLGRWAAGLLSIFAVMFLINGAMFQVTISAWWRENIMPFFGILMVLCALSSGIIGLIAIIRKHERSWMVWVTLLPLVFLVFLLLGEFLGPPH